MALQASYLSPVNEKIDVWKWITCALSSSEEGALKLLKESGSSTPVTDFVMFYLAGRDAVALHNIEDHFDDLVQWCSEYSDYGTHNQDSQFFWLCVAFIEIGRLDLAEMLITTKRLSSNNYQLACHLGSILTKEIRILPAKQKKHADKIIEFLDDKVQRLKQNLLDEFGSQLLEIRNQEVMALEDSE
ncbi:MAG: hypothetical protein ABW141_18645 [Candidatus Thiodiazotropha endolucinida]